MDRRCVGASATLRALHQTDVVKREPSWTAKLTIYQSICVPTVTRGHELQAATERMSVLDRAQLRDTVRSSA